MDALLERITAEAEHGELATIPWPEGLEPRPQRPPNDGSGPVPTADVLVVTYTTAEAEALADVFTPGVHRTEWIPYTHNWSEYEPQLTGRSPAHEEKCMAHYWLTMVANQRVIVMKSELHLATDGKSLPVAQMFKQLIAEAEPNLVITTGTAGGVGAQEVLGDVVLARAVKLNMAKSQFESEPWAQQSFTATYGTPQSYTANEYLPQVFNVMIPAAIGDHLKASGYAPRTPELITGKDVETVGYFAFADTADSYGVVKDDPNAGVEEMDDGAVALAISQLDDPPMWTAIRNASDPQMGGGSLQEQKSQAAAIYSKYGYYTTVCSALTCWAVIAGL